MAALAASASRSSPASSYALTARVLKLNGLNMSVAGSSFNTSTNTIRTKLVDVMLLGSKTQLHGIGSGDDHILCEIPGLYTAAAVGSSVDLAWPVAETLVYEVAA